MIQLIAALTLYTNDLLDEDFVNSFDPSTMYIKFIEMLKPKNPNMQRKVAQRRPTFDFFLDLSKSMPNVTANQIKTGFKLQPKFIATVR